MEIKKYEDILTLHTWFAAQVTKGLDARMKKVPSAEQLIAASGGERPGAKPVKAKKKSRPAKGK